MDERMQERVSFHYEHGGYSYHPKHETAEEGRQRCAREAAAAELALEVSDAYAEWSEDPDGWEDMEGLHYPGFQCVLYAADGSVLEGLHSIGLADDSLDDPYCRVVEAQLAEQAIGDLRKAT